MLATTQLIRASSNGISGYSGNPSTRGGVSCEQCHSGGMMPMVNLSGPMSVPAGSTNVYTLTISGGQKLYGGLDVSASQGVLAASDPGTHLDGGEVTHNAPKKAATNGDVTFGFSWTAPQTPGTVALYAAGLSSNGSGTGGDEVGRMALMVSVATPTPNQPPVADPGGPYTGIVGAPVSFDGSRSYDSDGTIASFAWDFGDGMKGTGAKASHTYATPGAFTVALTVTDNQGATNRVTVPCNVNAASANQPPTAFAGGPYSGLVATAITFDGSGSRDPDGSIASFDWDFGDGSKGTGAKPSHSYTSAAAYTVTLTVTDNQGAAASDTTSAVVTDSGAPSLLVWLGAPRQVQLRRNDQANALIRVVVDLSGLPPGTSGCGSATLLKGGQVVGTQPVCIARETESDLSDRESATGTERTKQRQRRTLEMKTAGGIIAVARPWKRGAAVHQEFSVPLSGADAPSVVWTARVELAGRIGESSPVTTNVLLK